MRARAVDPSEPLASMDLKTVRLLVDRWFAQAAYTQDFMENTSWELFYEYGLRGIVVRLQKAILSYEAEKGHLRVPSNWWEHFKERWFPRWARKRWPVRYRYYRARMYFPETEVPRGLTATEFTIAGWEQL